MDRDINFSTAAEALAYCEELMRTGVADLFRGQTNDWPTISPSLFRGSASIVNVARPLLAEFTEWANFVPQMVPYHDNPEEITAIAQHYGIPTPFLDLTRTADLAR